VSDSGNSIAAGSHESRSGGGVFEPFKTTSIFDGTAEHPECWVKSRTPSAANAADRVAKPVRKKVGRPFSVAFRGGLGFRGWLALEAGVAAGSIYKILLILLQRVRRATPASKRSGASKRPGASKRSEPLNVREPLNGRGK